MLNKSSYFILFFVLCLAISSCKQKENKSTQVSPNQNKIVVDESLQPIFDEELYIFNALYNDSTQKKDVRDKFDDDIHPISGINSTIIYAPENNVLKFFLEDSARVAILARDLTKEEYGFLKSRNSKPDVSRFAIDAIALIVNNTTTDTTITLSQIVNMLQGKAKLSKAIVFDNPNSGLVRYLQQLAGSKDLTRSNIYSLKSNKEVIKYVAAHPNAIGITGFSWLNDPDKDMIDFVSKVKIMSISDDVNKNSDHQYYTPSQNTLALNKYPLTRNLYILFNTSKLGLEFAAFLRSDRGQRIILKSGLLPDNIPHRRISIEKKIKY